MSSIEKLKQKEKELEGKLAEMKLQAKITELEKEIKGKGKRINLSNFEIKEGLSESEIAELQKSYERINFIQNNIRNSVSFPTDEQMKELENEKLSFGERLSEYSKKQRAKTEITDEMVEYWEGKY